MMGYHKPVDPADIWQYATRKLTDVSNIWQYATRKLTDVSNIWLYPTRTLTQDHFPFWTEVITLNYENHTIPADSVYTKYIQPPEGETWLIFYANEIANNGSGNHIILFKRQGSSHWEFTRQYSGGSYGDCHPHTSISVVINNSIYLEIQAHNDYSKNVLYADGYSGFKLGTKIAEFEEIETVKTIQSERLTKYKIKNEFEGLEDLIRDVYDDTIDDYKQVIYFYKDKPIRKDKRIGHIIERASSYIETDKLIENLGKVKTGELQLEKTGYKSWLEQIKKERRIDLLVRL